nr:signal peptidase II [Terrimesophilobacter mesophilus]
MWAASPLSRSQASPASAVTELSTGPAPEPPARTSVRSIATLVLVALTVYGVDQLTKFLIVANLREGEQVPVLGPVLQFHFVKNSGAAFSLASGSTWIFSIVAAGVTVFIVWYARRIRSVSWAILFGMLLGGTTGNLTDRLFREPSFGLGHVVDFVQVWGFPAIFNIADSFIVASMGLFIILSLRGTRLDGRRAVREPQV